MYVFLSFHIFLHLFPHKKFSFACRSPYINLHLRIRKAVGGNPLAAWAQGPLHARLADIAERQASELSLTITVYFMLLLMSALHVTTQPADSHIILLYSMEQSPSGEADGIPVGSRNSPHFMEPDGSLPNSKVPATCPYPEPALNPHIPLPKDPS